MKILVINPNSSVEMTQSIREALERIRRPDTVVEVVRLENGPSSIESATDGAMSTPLLLDRIRWANQEDFDAVIVACFSDPGLEPAREVSDVLVLGIQQTTLAVATMLGHKYTILTPLSSRIASKEQDVRRFRMDASCASVRALDLSVSQTEGDPELTKRRVKEVARAAIEQDGAEVIILGCAGMAGYSEDIERELGLVVLDPTSVTLKVAEGLAELEIRHSKRGLFHTPPERSQD